MRRSVRSGAWAAAFLAGAMSMAVQVAGAQAEEKKLPVVFTGGHETDPRDGGRPVVLVAAGLGVKTEVFREAFRGVTPAQDGRPTPDQARRNKDALMKALGPHGVTNDRLDEVSNYYRYRRERGEMWPTTAAKAHAVVVDGKVTKIVVTEAGAGYSSSPTAKIEGLDGVRLTVKLHFGKELKSNGSVADVEVAKDAK